MRCPARGAALAALFLGAAAAHGEPGTVLEAVAVRDTGGFAPGVTALAVRAPRGWTSRGALAWTANPECVALPVSVAFRTVRGDGLAGFEVMPAAMRPWASDPEANRRYERAAADGVMGCLAPARAFRVQGYIDDLFLGIHRKGREGLRILFARRLAAIADRIEARLTREIGPRAFDRLRAAGGRAAVYGDAGLFDIGYTIRGRAIRERVFVSLGVTEIVLPDPAGGTVTRASGFTDQVVSWFAPEDEFAALAPVFDFMLASTAWNRRWLDTVARAGARVVFRRRPGPGAAPPAQRRRRRRPERADRRRRGAHRPRASRAGGVGPRPPRDGGPAERPPRGRTRRRRRVLRQCAQRNPGPRRRRGARSRRLGPPAASGVTQPARACSH